MVLATLSSWLVPLFTDGNSIATCVMILSLVIAAGRCLGRLRFGGVELGITGVLFAGLVFGHFGLSANAEVLAFVREFGLILFVFSIGLSVGPSFVNLFRARGIRLNALAAAIVVAGALVTCGISLIAGIPMPIVVGMFSGATTNTPSLAAAGDTLRSQPLADDEALAALAKVSPTDAAKFSAAGELSEVERQALASEVHKMPGLGYAVTYPCGVLGIILSMIALRRLLRADPQREAEELAQIARREQPGLIRFAIRVTNRNLFGATIEQIPSIDLMEVVISRVRREGKWTVARPDWTLAENDILLAVGAPDRLDDLRAIVGETAQIDWEDHTGDVVARWLLVSKASLVNRTVPGLTWSQRCGVQITRIHRGDQEFSPMSRLPLSLGDQVLAVGPAEGVAQVARELGDSPRELDIPQLVPVFVGIILGIILGSWPIELPGVPSPVKLGLAGGPLLMALFLSQIGRIGPLVWYLPPAANLTLRDFGITLFLAAVGLKSGDRFVETLTHGDGLLWLVWGVAITVVPLVVVGIAAKAFFRMSYLNILGLLAGSMTDPPALAFANARCQSDVPALAYATVYPLAMVLRVICVQVMVLLLG